MEIVKSRPSSMEAVKAYSLLRFRKAENVKGKNYCFHSHERNIAFWPLMPASRDHKNLIQPPKKIKFSWAKDPGFDRITVGSFAGNW